MALYTLFFIRDGALVSQARHDLGGDCEAVEAARAQCDGYTVEIYLDTRLVARVKQGEDQPFAATDLTGSEHGKQTR